MRWIVAVLFVILGIAFAIHVLITPGALSAVCTLCILWFIGKLLTGGRRH
jgi:hypothetical protein